MLHTRTAVLLITLWTMLVGGCDREGPGSQCLSSDECASGLCFVNICRAPGADDDGDGLNNAQEHRINTHPDRADTDGDGKDDGLEVGQSPASPVDTDGDGVIDALESQVVDRDLDCIVDERDADDALPNSDLALLAKLACSSIGVCKGKAEQISASCQVGAGTLTCDYSAVDDWSAVESCDGLDNDCDGLTDEGHSYQGVPVGQGCAGRGACGPGVVVCQLGLARCSSNPGGASSRAKEELCDGLDNDCDGETDETFARDGVPVGVPCVGRGECGVGLVVCSSSGEPVCSTDVTGPASEAKPETCNGLDDDCDGETDESISLAGVPIGGPCVSVGACGPGTVACSSAGEVLCSTSPGGPEAKAAAELCNGLDDDCDGETDEGFVWAGLALGSPCDGIGACGAGKVVCSLLGGATCSSMPDAPGSSLKLELCDGLDNDCDGETDEGLAWQGTPLGGACKGLGACGDGVVECTSTGTITCSSQADGSKSTAKTELCNGVDDDCDGVTDDEVPPALAPACSTKGVCAAVKGAPVCVAGVWSCTYGGLSTHEAGEEQSCDLKDNDCDGQVDEGLPHQWASQPSQLFHLGPAARANAAVATTASEFCVAGGVQALLTSDTKTNADDMWCLRVKDQVWRKVASASGVARSGATLAKVSTTQWWLFGGKDDNGVPQVPVEIDDKTGAVSNLSWAAPPGSGAVFTVDGAMSYLRLDGGGGSRCHQWSASKKWSSVSDNLSDEVLQHACQDDAGTLWAIAQAPKTAQAAAAVKFLSAKTVTKWSAQAAPLLTPADVAGARLLCDVAPGQIWLLGAPGPSGEYALQRFSVSKGTWSTTTAVKLPQTAAASVGRVGSVAVAAWGAAPKDETPEIWWTASGSWQPVTIAPHPSLGARWLNQSGVAYRIGGARLAPDGQGALDKRVWRADGQSWTHADSKWPGAMSPFVAPDAESSVLLWGGTTTLPVSAKALDLGLSTQASAGRLNLKTGAWKPLPSGHGLPQLRTDALLTHGMIGTKRYAWLLGRTQSAGPTQLWQVDAVSAKATLLWSAATQGPGAYAGGQLIWDGVHQQVLCAVSSGGLRIWAWDTKTGKAWKQLALDVTVADGAAMFIGDPVMNDLLVAVLPNDSGGQSALRRFTLSPKPTLSSTQVSPPTWTPPVVTWWDASQQRAWLMPQRNANGSPYLSVLGWSRACVSPSQP